MLQADQVVFLVNRIATCLLAIGVLMAAIVAVTEWRQRRAEGDTDRELTSRRCGR